MIDFVILHYQAVDETENCVKNIREMMTSEFYHIVIVDNASPNGSGNVLKKEYSVAKDVTVLLSNENLGFAKGNNLGYSYAKKNNPDFIVVMNNDVLLTQKDFEKRIIDCFNCYNFDVLGPDIYSTKTKLHQNPQKNRNFTLIELKKSRIKLRIKNKLNYFIKLKYKLVKDKTSTPKQVTDYKTVQIGKPLHGAAYIFSKKFIKAHDNCFYPMTFMYYESYILHYLGMKENLVFLYSPTVKLIHHEDVATNISYDSRYKKSTFINKCLFDSCNEYIKVMEDEKSIIG